MTTLVTNCPLKSSYQTKPPTHHAGRSRLGMSHTLYGQYFRLDKRLIYSLERSFRHVHLLRRTKVEVDDEDSTTCYVSGRDCRSPHYQDLCRDVLHNLVAIWAVG